MSLELHRDGERVTLRLNGPLGVQQVGDLYQLLTEALPCDSVLELDASQVERLDTSIAQLFAYFASRVRRLEVLAASGVWEDTMRTLGLACLLRKESPPRNRHGNENDPIGR